jgi:hypothetical protein
MKTELDQYMDIFKDAVEDSAAKLTKSFEKMLIEVIILFIVIPRKIKAIVYFLTPIETEHYPSWRCSFCIL